jgi:hypothetical protein
MKRFLVPVLLPFVVQCGSSSSKSDDQTRTADASAVTAPTAAPTPAPLSVIDPVPAPPALDPTQSSALTIQFKAKVGKDDLLCTDKTAASLQSGQIFTDLRLFVSNLTLVDEQGKEHRIQLDVADNSSNLQYVDTDGNSISLLNFLESSCASSDATKKLKSEVTGLLQQGVYKEIRFQLGLPYAPMDEALTQVPAALAPSDMGWMWQHFPADIQIEMHSGKSKKLLNALTSANKRLISLPIQHVQNPGASQVTVQMDLSRLFPVDATSFVNSLESACNNSNKVMTENAPNCAFAFKALGLEVANAKAPYEQSLFSWAQ